MAAPLCFAVSPPLPWSLPPTQRNIKDHHYRKPGHGRHGNQVDVSRNPLGFRDQLLDNDKDHGSGRKAERIGKYALHLHDKQYPDNAGNRFNYSRGLPHKEAFPLPHAFSSQRHGYCCPFREILESNPDCEGNGAAECRGWKTGNHRPEGDTDRKTFGDVVQGDCQNQQGAPLPGGLYPLALIDSQTRVQVRQQAVGQSHENAATHETDHRSQPGCLSHLLSHLDTRREQRPEACGNHDAGSKTEH